MAPIAFNKWEGTGNDFIVIDDRSGSFPQDVALVQRLCDRHFGIGSDGLILVQAPRSTGMDYHMEFFNPDGSKSFCGNGARVAFAAWSELSGKGQALFTAIDGEHSAEQRAAQVVIGMRDTAPAQRLDGEHDFLHTGSPHAVVRVADVAAVDVAAEGVRIRHAAAYAPAGTNVNFVHLRDGVLHMRTFERGVEAETLSCGTGVTAAALSVLATGELRSPVAVRAPGGELAVEADLVDGAFRNVRLAGPVRKVFSGNWNG